MKKLIFAVVVLTGSNAFACALCNPDCPTGPTGISWHFNDGLLLAQDNPGPPTGAAPPSKNTKSRAQIKAFLQRVDDGQFDNALVHMDSHTPVARALMSDVPISHRASWTVNLKEGPNGYTKTYILTTKKGHTVKIVLDE
jgi:hypothetical protein